MLQYKLHAKPFCYGIQYTKKNTFLAGQKKFCFFPRAPQGVKGYAWDARPRRIPLPATFALSLILSLFSFFRPLFLAFFRSKKENFTAIDQKLFFTIYRRPFCCFFFTCFGLFLHNGICSSNLNIYSQPNSSLNCSLNLTV